MLESITPGIDWANSDQGAAIKLFKQQYELHFSVKEVKKEKQVDHTLLLTGANGIRMFNSWGLSKEEGKDPELFGINLFRIYSSQEKMLEWRDCTCKSFVSRKMRVSTSLSRG